VWTPERDALGLVRHEAEGGEAGGLVAVLAHPERCSEIVEAPDRAAEFCERGWLLALNGLSLDGRHGPDAYEAAWRLLEDGLGDLVASDGHRSDRNARLDFAYNLVAARLGLERAHSLFDGSALDALHAGSVPACDDPLSWRESRHESSATGANACWSTSTAAASVAGCCSTRSTSSTSRASASWRRSGRSRSRRTPGASCSFSS